MVLTAIGFKWYDGFFLSMLASSAIVVAVNWNKYLPCPDPIHVWIVGDYGAIFLFRCLTFVDCWISSQLRRTMSGDERTRWFLLRLVFLLPLAFSLYPFLWYWTIIGSFWLYRSSPCLPEAGQMWGFLVWLAFCFCALFILSISMFLKWHDRRKLYGRLVELGAPAISDFKLLVEILRDPDFGLRNPRVRIRTGGAAGVGGMGPTWENAEPAQEPDGFAFLPGLRLTPVQKEIIERAILQLPRFYLKAPSPTCASCPICLEDFGTSHEVRSLPCAHVFHVHCIDPWLRLNMRCPHCRSNVFPGLDLVPPHGTSRAPQNPPPPPVLAETLEQGPGQSDTIPLRPTNPNTNNNPNPNLAPILHSTISLSPSPSPFLTPVFSPQISPSLSPGHRHLSQSSRPLLEEGQDGDIVLEVSERRERGGPTADSLARTFGSTTQGDCPSTIISIEMVRRLP